MSPRSWTSLLPLIPATLLTVVTLFQALQVRGDRLSLGQSYGFGIVTSLDEPQTRQVRVWVTDAGGERRIEESPGNQFEELQALNLPSTERLQRLARKAARAERSWGGEPTAVRVQVWGTSYAPETLRPQAELIREVVVDLPVGGGAAR